jgi:hypothetical protein
MTRISHLPAAGSGRPWSRRSPVSPAGRSGAASAAIVAVLVLAAGAALAFYAVASRGQRTAAGHPARPAAAAPAAGSAAAPAGPAPLHLVTGSHLVDGVLTRYPRSQAGFVSAAVEFTTELGSTLEPARAAAIARLAASPSYPAAAQAATTQAIAVRRNLGLPAAGSVPPDTAVFLVPVMYQLRAVSPDQVTVLLLFDYTKTTAAGIHDQLGVTAVRLGWTPASWRLLPPAGSGPSAPELSALIATPGSAAAAAHGWKAMINAL